jgi:plasmid stabilization system protein ParE
MGRFQFTPQALDDLFEIWSYIARDSAAAADRVEESIYIACELLAGSPLAGTVRRDLTSLPVRFWIVRRRRLEAVLTVDYVNEANSEASFQGRSSSMRLMG